MIVERGNIRLITLAEEHIQLVREKRNLPEIRSRMEYREHITTGMQKEWFASVNNTNNLHFLIEVQNKFIGLISAVEIDWDTHTVNNGGIFIWDRWYWQSPEVVQASVLLTDFGYYFGIKRNYVRILNDNSAAIAFNTAIGYKLLPDQNTVYNQQYELSPQAYFQNTKKIRAHSSLNNIINIFISEEEYLNRQLAQKIIKKSDEHFQKFDVEIHII